MSVKVQSHKLPNVGQRGVDRVGEGQVVHDMLLPIGVAGEQALRPIAPVLGHARAVEGHHSAHAGRCESLQARQSTWR